MHCVINDKTLHICFRCTIIYGLMNNDIGFVRSMNWLQFPFITYNMFNV